MSDPFQNRPTTHYDSGQQSDVASSAAAAKDTAAQAKDAAAGVADTGKQAATEVAQTGKDAARDVAQQTKEQASDLLGRTRDQLDEQIRSQQGSLVETLRDLGDQLASMTDNTDEHGTAVDVASRARDRARSAADWLDNREPDQVLDELRRVGRQRPGAFLLGAAVAGVVAGRLTRGVVAVHADDLHDNTGREDTSTGSSPRPFIASTADRPTPGRHEAVRPPVPSVRPGDAGLYGNGIPS